MSYLDSKIIGFINFFYDEIQKQKMPWVVNVHLYDDHIPLYTTILPYLYEGITIEIIRTDMDLCYTKTFKREQLTLPKASPEDLAKCAFEEIRKELDRWSLENH